MDVPAKIQVGYWKIRGLAQPIRLLLKYAGQDFENIMYEQGEAPDYSKDAWRQARHHIGLPFPNLPYLIDGDIRITQSNAILRHLGSKFNLLGETEKVRAESDMVLEIALDFRNALARILYSKDYDKLIDSYFRDVHTSLRAFDEFLQGRSWFGGGQNPTTCDFPMYELMDQHRLMRPDILSEYPNLQAFLDRFEQLPKIKAYMNLDEFISRPCNNKHAGWR